MESIENLLEGKETGERIHYSDAVVTNHGPAFVGAVSDRAIYWGTGLGPLRRVAIADVASVKLSHRGQEVLIAGAVLAVVAILGLLAHLPVGGFLFIGIVLLVIGSIMRRPSLAITVSGKTYTWAQPRARASGGLQRRYPRVRGRARFRGGHRVRAEPHLEVASSGHCEIVGSDSVVAIEATGKSR